MAEELDSPCTEELTPLGIHAGLVVANQVLTDGAVATSFGRSRRAMQEKCLAELGEQILGPVDDVSGERLVARATDGHGV